MRGHTRFKAANAHVVTKLSARKITLGVPPAGNSTERFLAPLSTPSVLGPSEFLRTKEVECLSTH